MPLVLLQPHERDLGGGLRVRRLLPAAQKQAVGPFIFFDHFGPIDVPADANHDVRPHPHIGLATVTYLFEGAMMHRDSLGAVQRIEPGAINWMTAGRGIVHSERTPDDLKGQPRRSHGLQLWAALPLAHEEDEPTFRHTPAGDIPALQVEGCSVRVLIGNAFGASSPVATLMETLYLDLDLPAAHALTLDAATPERAVYTLGDSVTIDGHVVPPHTLALLAAGQATRIEAPRGARVAVIGGAPLDGGRRFIWWNFVSSRKERIAQAAQDWQQRRFADVPGEMEWIPLPPAPAP